MLPLLTLGQQAGNFIEKSQTIYMPFSITSYGTKHGLPQNQILDIIQKKDGELIISTANGIVEYNGHEFYDIIDNSEYKKSIHSKIYWNDQFNTLYGYEDISKFNQINKGFKRLKDIYTAYLSKDTLICITNNGKVFKRILGQKKGKLIIDTKIKNVHNLFFFKNGLYISSGNNTYHFDLKTRRKTLIIQDFITCFKENSFTGGFYASSNSQVYKIKGEKASIVDLGVEPNGGLITDIEFMSSDELFVSTTAGLIYYTSYYSERYEEDDYLPTNYIQSLFYDQKEQCLFVGTGNKGLLKLQVKNCSSMVENFSLAKASLCSIIRDHQKRVLIASSDTKVYQLDIETCTDFYSDKSGFSSMSEINQQLYLGTWGNGVLIVKNQKQVGHILYPKIKSNIVHASYKDRQGDIWIGTGKGLSKGKSPSSIRPFLSHIIQNRCITFYELRNGDLCIGGAEGIYILNKKRELIKHISAKDGLKCKEVRSFLEDHTGKLWIGTYDGGLYCYATNKLTSINKKKNCNLNPDVFTLARDSRGYIYMSSNNGLYVIEEKKLTEFYNNQIDYLIPFHYTNENGIKNTEFNGGFQNNFLMSKMDHLYLPTIEGVLVASPDNYAFRKLNPKIKTIRVNDTIINQQNNEFERTTHSIEFNFYCPNYISKYNIHYQYKLIGKGLPNTWSSIQKASDIRFSMLPPGDYIFQIRGVDAYNDSHPKINTYKFRIKPYFYETWWFITLFLICLTLIIIYLVRFRIYQLRVRERKEHRISNTILELKLKAIQSKMNPHFIFNSLNNIIYLLNSNQVKAAEDLLQDFSLLLRQFLESSDQTFISLKEEFAIIDLYLAIEQRRKNDQFTYHVHVDETIENKQIPTLLLQPLVENAVIHGIGHSDKACEINISAAVISNDIVIKIADNGIGRTASKKINESRKNHTSVGMALVKEKMNIMYLKYDKLINLTIEDLDKTTKTGTLVIIKIPLND